MEKLIEKVVSAVEKKKFLKDTKTPESLREYFYSNFIEPIKEKVVSISEDSFEKVDHNTGYAITLADKKIFVSTPNGGRETCFGIYDEAEDRNIIKLTVYHGYENSKVEKNSKFVDLDVFNVYPWFRS